MKFIQLTKYETNHKVNINFDNVTIFQKRSDDEPTEIFFVGEDEEFYVKESPKEIFEKIHKL
jgi:hypothetical protein